MVLDLAERVDAEQAGGGGQELRNPSGSSDLPEGHVENHCRLYLALEQFLAEQGLTPSP